MNKIQLTKKQIQTLDECVMIELGYVIQVAANTSELQVLHKLLEPMYRGRPDAQKDGK